MRMGLECDGQEPIVAADAERSPGQRLSKPRPLNPSPSSRRQTTRSQSCPLARGAPRRNRSPLLTEALAAGGDEAKRAFDAMMGMKKIDVAAIKAARRG
jgi:hypothetical protein